VNPTSRLGFLLARLVVFSAVLISSSSLLAAMHDRASVNDVAIRTIKVVYPVLLNVGCFSYTLDLVGGKFNTPHLSDSLGQSV